MRCLHQEVTIHCPTEHSLWGHCILRASPPSLTASPSTCHTHLHSTISTLDLYLPVIVEKQLCLFSKRFFYSFKRPLLPLTVLVRHHLITVNKNELIMTLPAHEHDRLKANCPQTTDIFIYQLLACTGKWQTPLLSHSCAIRFMNTWILSPFLCNQRNKSLLVCANLTLIM